MSSLSPENQPSSLPPDLIALVLILFDVGGVDSMIAEKEAKKTHTKRARDVARDGLIDSSCEREQLHQNLKRNRTKLHSIDVSGFQSSKRKYLTKTYTENVRKSRKSHGHHM